MLKQDTFKIQKIMDQRIWTLAQIKNYLRISHNYDDELISTIILTAISAVENYTGMHFVQKKVEYIAISQSRLKFDLKFRTILEINTIKITDDITSKTLLAGDYTIDYSRSIIYLIEPLTANQKLVIEFTVGFQQDLIPPTIKQGILIHICEMYDRDGESGITGFSNEIKNLYSPYRLMRI